MIITQKNINVLQAKKFGEAIMYKSNYVFIYKSMLGILNGITPWIDSSNIEFKLKNVGDKDKIILKFFALSQRVDEKKLTEAIGVENVNFLIDVGYAHVDGLCIVPDNYALIPILNKLYAVNTAYKEEGKNKKMIDLYVGDDSLKLLNFIYKIKGGRILDMCAGPGTIGIAIGDSATSVDFAEVNEKAINALYFNLFINDIPLHKVNVYKSDMFRHLNKTKYDYIISNPPFVPTPTNEKLPLCGDGGEDGLKFVKEIVSNAQEFLNFNGKLFMVLETIGNHNAPFIMKLLNDKFKQGILNVSLMERQIIERQSMYSAKISSEINGVTTEYKHLYEKWQEMFRREGATYIYPTLIEYINTNERLQVNVVRNYNKISRHTKFAINDNITLQPFNKKMFRISANEKNIVIDEEIAMMVTKGDFGLKDNISEKDVHDYTERMNVIKYLNENEVIKIM